MYMFYLTKKTKWKETLVAVIGNEEEAKKIDNALNEYYMNEPFRIRGLYHLLKEKVIIPSSMAWIVESDRKHQERETESRNKNLMDENSLSFPKKD